MSFDLEQDDYKPVYISFRLSANANEVLTKACVKSGRKKVQEAKIRLEDHLSRVESISQIGHVLNRD